MVERKTHDERESEILDAAEQIFGRKGVDKATVNDILDAVGIGKGTFYYYFKSKEEVMEAVIFRFVDKFSAAAQKIADDPELDAHEKFKEIAIGLNGRVEFSDWIFNELHKVENGKMHQKSIVEMITALAPIMTEVVEQGIAEGIYHTPYPKEMVDIILVANQFLFDLNIFRTGLKEIENTTVAFIHALELMLGAEAGSFDYLLENVKIQLGKVEENGKKVAQ